METLPFPPFPFPFPSAFSFYNRLTVARPHFPLFPIHVLASVYASPRPEGGPKKEEQNWGDSFWVSLPGFLSIFGSIASNPLLCMNTRLHGVKANFRLCVRTVLSWRKALRKYHFHNVCSLQCNEMRNI